MASSAWRRCLPAVAAIPLGIASCDAFGKKKLRSQDFDLARHSHGKTRIRVLKVRRGEDGVHSVSEYKVATTLYSPDYERVFTKGVNAALVATDTQKNTVYALAKRTEAKTPEDFGIAIAGHLLREYPILTSARVDVEEITWARAAVEQDGNPLPHAHGFLRSEPEHARATVAWRRGEDAPEVKSAIEKLVLLKTTQSGFKDFARDKYTLLPETTERCMATELNTEWTYNTAPADYAAVRRSVRAGICKGFFGSPISGVYSESLQASVYDAGCLVLSATPCVQDIEIDTPNLHYLPAILLNRVGDADDDFADDVFIPTSEPSGSINCVVSRGDGPRAPEPVTLKADSAGAAAAAAKARAAIEAAVITRKANSCPMAIRLAWHASGTFDEREGTGGSGGATMRHDGGRESLDGANAGLGIERDILKPVLRACPELSTGDVWTLAGATAVELCGGPKIDHALGRVDAPRSACPPPGRLPDAAQGAAHLRKVFYRMGFNDKEIVALSGAHTLGRCHKTRSGFDGPWTSKPLVFDNEYFVNLIERDWVAREWDSNFQYTDAATKSLTMLPTDVALKTDPKFRVHAERYARDEAAFKADFKAAFEKLITLGVETRSDAVAVDESDAGADAAAAKAMREECMHGSIEHARAIYAKRPSLPANAADQGSNRTALHKAAFWGHDHIIPWLVDDLGVNLESRDADGDGALHDAARFGHAKVVAALLARGASKAAVNDRGQTPFDVAEENAKAEVLAPLRV